MGVNLEREGQHWTLDPKAFSPCAFHIFSGLEQYVFIRYWVEHFWISRPPGVSPKLPLRQMSPGTLTTQSDGGAGTPRGSNRNDNFFWKLKQTLATPHPF